MLVSVIIPAYNEEKYLPATLQSIKSQQPEDFDYEVIVADAQSTDQTAQVGKDFGAKVISVPKLNPATARQKAVEQSKGEIICCVDADTQIPKNFLKLIAKEFRNDPQAVALTGIIEGLGRNPLFNFIYKWGNTFFSKLNFLLGRPGLQGQSFAFRKTAFKKIGGFNTSLHTGEDFDLGIRFSKIGKVKLTPYTFGFSSTRRFQEGPAKAISRGFFSYLKVVWKIPFYKKFETEEVPAIR